MVTRETIPSEMRASQCHGELSCFSSAPAGHGIAVLDIDVSTRGTLLSPLLSHSELIAYRLLGPYKHDNTNITPPTDSPQHTRPFKQKHATQTFALENQAGHRDDRS